MIEPRIEEIFSLVNQVMRESGVEEVLSRGMVLTGGGSLLKNLDQLITKVTGVPCYVAEDALLCVAIN